MAQTHLPPALQVREMRIITQTITRASTTITTLVTLGDPTAVMDTAQPTEEPPPPPPPAAAPATMLPPAPSPGTLSSEQLGALLGSVLGFAFLVLVICCCLSCRRRRRRPEQRVVFYGTGSEYSGSGSELEATREFYTSTRDWNQMRGPGGVGFANAEGMMGGFGGMPRRTDAGFTTVPPPARFPPTPRHTPYRQSRWPQISGVRRFP